jgi:proteasome beta subunit
MVDSKEVVKIENIFDNIYMTTAGSSADNQFLKKIISSNLELLKIKGNVSFKVEDVVNYIGTILFYNKGFFMIHPLVAGYDIEQRLFELDAAGAYEEKKDFAATGSGSVFAYGVLEANWKSDLSEKQAIELVEKAIRSAAERDVFSGGRIINLVVIKKDEVKQEKINM